MEGREGEGREERGKENGRENSRDDLEQRNGRRLCKEGEGEDCEDVVGKGG